MKKIILIIVLSLIATTSQSAISNRLDSLRTHIRMRWNAAGDSTRLLTNNRLTYILNEASDVVCIDFPALIKVDTVTITASDEVGGLSSDFVALASVFRLKGESERIPMTIVDIGMMDSLRHWIVEPEGHQHQLTWESPQYCASAGQKLMTHPKMENDPTFGNDFLVYYYAIDDWMSDDTSTTQILPEYIPALLFYAVAMTYEELGLFSQGAYYHGKYTALKKEKGRKAVSYQEVVEQ